MDSKGKQMNGSLASQNQTTFNNQIENTCKIQYQQQIQADEQQLQEKLNQFPKYFAGANKNNLLALTFCFELVNFQSTLSEICVSLANVDNDVYYNLQSQIRNIFKQLNDSVGEFIEKAKESQYAYLKQEIVDKINKLVVDTKKQLNQIKQDVYSETKKYVIWVDFNDSQENKTILQHLQSQYKTPIIIKCYSNIDVFKDEFPQYAGQLLFLILSGQVANDHAPTDGRLFNWLKEQQNQNKKQDQFKIIMKGIVVFTSDIGVKKIKDKFMYDQSKLVRCVTSNVDEVVNTLNSMIASQI